MKKKKNKKNKKNKKKNKKKKHLLECKQLQIGVYGERQGSQSTVGWLYGHIGLLLSLNLGSPRTIGTNPPAWGRGHDGLVNCARTGMSKSVSISKTCVSANAIY